MSSGNGECRINNNMKNLTELFARGRDLRGGRRSGFSHVPSLSSHVEGNSLILGFAVRGEVFASVGFAIGFVGVRKLDVRRFLDLRLDPEFEAGSAQEEFLVGGLGG